jgi:lipopolysaccharide/colanic/teichoic acid biosynthesis glycosyltransferase
MIRFFDILFALIGLILCLPLFLALALLIRIDSRGPVFFRQSRVGKDNRDFLLFKFRSMREGSEPKGALTVGNRDSRITRVGYFLRRSKLDELPQLLNVLNGSMSIVGPRPELRRFVDFYTGEQKKVLAVRPGITDWASIEYINENELLAKADDPEKRYVEEIMPAKINLNMRFINNPSTGHYFRIIFRTILGIFS